MKGIIELNEVSFDYKSVDQTTVGVKNISLSIKEGDFVALIGHNGSGKSTLAKLFNGFLIPDTGDVIVKGMNTKEKKNTFEIRKKVGMVFQTPDNQMVASIIEDDIAFGAENLGVPREEIIRRVEWALSAVDMLEYKKHTPFKLSGGQKQRIAIAAILAMMPEVLILDESTAMLDPEGRKEVLEVVKKLNKEHNMTVVLITHYMEEAIDADEVYIMNEGEIVDFGKPEEVFKDYKKLNSVKLEVPIVSQVIALLQKDGYPIKNCLKVEELAEEICRLR
ncbi:MAG: energy-coupling factor transporter ATPase [Bacillota bacterium]|jgi:energy-coupling factor transport system ATP-binding protein|nr:energy-coupling factor transporter ATPase [Bacillota bacterium]HHU43934.1 energy-coupling factor transporter ATPase [Clostridiales bacterium]